MSKRKRDNGARVPFMVGEMGHELGSRYLALDAREAVRAWCTANEDELRETRRYDVSVWSDSALEPWSDFQRWRVDLTQQPAFLLHKVKADEPAEEVEIHGHDQ